MQEPNIFSEWKKAHREVSQKLRERLIDSREGEPRRGRAEARHGLTTGSSPQEQPVKSTSAAVVVVPGVTFSGMAVASLLVV